MNGNNKLRSEVKKKQHLFVLNEKLQRALKKANLKITEVKEKYRTKQSRHCYYCNNELDLGYPTLSTSFEQVNITTMGDSFYDE